MSGRGGRGLKKGRRTSGCRAVSLCAFTTRELNYHRVLRNSLDVVCVVEGACATRVLFEYVQHEVLPALAQGVGAGEKKAEEKYN